MKQKSILQVLGALIALILFVVIITNFLLEPLAVRKLVKKFNERSRDYHIEISDADISIFRPGIKLSHILIYPDSVASSKHDLKGSIDFIHFKGIDLWKALFKNKVEINEIIVANTLLRGKIPFAGESDSVKTAGLHLSTDRIIFDGIDIDIGNTSNASTYAVKHGNLSLAGINLQPHDTLSPAIFRQIEFKAETFSAVTADSLYTLTVHGIMNQASPGSITADSISAQPNYTDYEFAAHNEFETDRIEAVLKNLLIQDVSPADFLSTGNLQSSYIEIGKMEVEAFRDKRKKFRHANKPMFQDLIKNYPGRLRIDSVGILDGKVTYIEHAEEAGKAGKIYFNDLNAKIYNINNVSIDQHEDSSFILRAKALLMGQSRLSVVLKANLADKYNTFSVNGNMAGMKVEALNPILVNNAFIYPNSGQVDAMSFTFTANKNKATGILKLLYKDLNVAVVDKKTRTKDAMPEQLMSFFANLKLLNSNPLPGQEIRTGIINYERDPERFLFNYCFKSILSGIKSSITEPEKKKKKKRR